MARRTLSGKRALITGASSGIGRELARELVGKSAQVIATGRRPDRLAELQAECHPRGQIVTVVGNIEDEATRRHLLDTADREFGGLDILINSAGVGALGPFAAADSQRLRRIM